VAICLIKEKTPEWHAIRLKNIGGSEIAGLFGLHAAFGQSAYALHMVKSGRIPEPPVEDGPGSRVWFGVHMEPIIAAMGAELYRWTLEKGGYCTDDQQPGMACSVDFVITEPGPAEVELGFTGPGILQIKNTDWLNHRREWVGGEPPHWILLQLQHEIACAGYAWGAILPCIGGNELPVYRYAARPVTAALIRDRIAEFWEGVRTGKPPSIDGSDSTADAIRAAFPSVPDTQPIDLRGHNELPFICTQFILARENKKASDSAYQAAKNELEAILAGHTKAETDGYRITVAVVKETPPRAPGPGEMIGGRASSRRLTVTERIEK
jgi:predicted phage-related endonuclease